MKKMTQEEFINRAKQIHGDKYDYSKTQFRTTKKKVLIVCPKHGEFYQLANNHLHGYGCVKCAQNNVPQYGRRRVVFGVGINDSVKAISKGRTRDDCDYYTWHGMIQRCYDKKFQEKHPTYTGCTVCDEWKTFSNFQKWFTNPANGYKEGYHLDKDILIKRNKIYSPQTCCFVPSEINMLFTKTNKLRGNLPIGVQHYANGRYKVLLQYHGYPKYLGIFNTIQEAFSVYKIEKEKYIKELANEYYLQGKITQKVYDAMNKYEVEIND